MAKPKKIIVREIKKNIKITEIKKEEEVKPEIKEESLEDLTDSAPSSREFPQFNEPAIRAQQQAEAQPEAGTEARTDEQAQTPAQPTYTVHNVTEGELQRTYEARLTGRNQGEAIRNPMVAPRGTSPSQLLQDSEVQAMRNQREQEEQNKYEVSLEPQHEVKKRKYPWEA